MCVCVVVVNTPPTHTHTAPNNILLYVNGKLAFEVYFMWLVMVNGMRTRASVLALLYVV